MTWRDLIGTQIDGRYTLRTLLDAGSHQSEFFASVSGNGEKQVSIALVEAQPEEAREELAAISRARQLRHPNLLCILDAGECRVEDAPMLFIVTEAAERTLAATLAAGALQDPEALLDDVLDGLEWLHGQGLVYRNLAPDTIVRAGGRWKLADLSQLHEAGEFGPSDAAGRAVPPEAAAGTILPAWDVWALGVLLQDAIADERGRLPAPYQAIVRGCLEADPAQRITPAGIRTLLKTVPPEPVAEIAPPIPPPIAPPVPEPLYEEPVEPRPRVPVAVIAAVLIVSAVVLAWLLFGRSTTPSPGPARVTQPAAATPQPAPPPPMPAPTATPPPQPARATAPVPKPKPAAPAQHVGRADYAADDLEGQLTASGERFSNHAMTASSREFPMGAHLRVTNLQNGRHVTVRVNDRGPHRHGYIISLTRHAADQLGFIKAGSARVKIEAVK